MSTSLLKSLRIRNVKASFAATKHHGAPFVSYILLAEMVRAGWRRTAEPTKDDVTPRSADDRQ